MQAAFDLGEPRQNDITFPVTLAEKYQPAIADFVGLKEPKRIMLGLLANPKPCSLLFVGEPGCGKTSMAMKFAEQLPAAHHHIRAQSADVETLDRIWEHCQYYPAKGQFHVVHIDEVDGATDKAQLQLLSRMDGTARLKPTFGGGYECGEIPPIIYIFTCNGRIEDGVMKPPAALLPRFLSRCIALYFEPLESKDLAKYLAAIWKREGKGELPMPYLEFLATGTGVRDALMRLDSELIAPHTPEEIRGILKAETERREKLERQRGDKLHILTAALLKPGGIPENKVCGHLNQPHYARGLCLPCYRLFRAGQRKIRKAAR